MTTLNQDIFKNSLNTQFSIQHANDKTQLTLIECSNLTSENVPDYERFSLIFESSDPLLSQATYTLEHPAIGNQDLFLVPIHGDDKSFQYEAVINRKIDIA